MSDLKDTGSRMAGRARNGADEAWRLTVEAIPEFLGHRCPQLAAGIAYFALLSVFPTAIVLTAAYGLVAGAPGAESEVVSFIVERLPLSGEGTADIRAALESVAGSAGTVGLAGLVGLVYSASALMAAARNSLNEVFEVDEARAPLRGKLVDIALVFGLGGLFGTSLVVALLGGVASGVGKDLGIPGILLDGSLGFVAELLPMAIAAVVFGVALTVMPAHRPGWRDVWPGVLVATLGYKLVQLGFGVYLENFGSYSAIYGSLGAVIAFMVFVYLVAMAFLLGAQYAALWPRARAGELGASGDGPAPPLRQRLAGWLGRLVRNPER